MTPNTIKQILRRSNYILILASRSPRRRHLLKKMGIPFKSVVPTHQETFNHKNIRQELIDNTVAKALCIKSSKPALIIAGDTVIVYNGRVLGKPKDRTEARRFLTQFSGTVHEVWTGVAVLNSISQRSYTSVVKTRVKFKLLTPQDIEKYLDTGEYKDKAGAYGIQGHGGRLIQKISGDYENVVGFPTKAVRTLIERACLNIKK